MKIEWKDTEDIEGIGQFVVHAESDIEAAIMRRFTHLAMSKGWDFVLHGYGFNIDKAGCRNFNFGLRKK